MQACTSLQTDNHTSTPQNLPKVKNKTVLRAITLFYYSLHFKRDKV